MKHTRETVRRHLSPWVILAWLALIGVAVVADKYGIEIIPTTYIEMEPLP